MGRPRKEIDTELMIDLLAEGLSKTEVAAVLGVTPPTIENRVKELRSDESALLAYDKVHFLDLIRVKERLVANMTEQKMVEAHLGTLANAYGIIAKQEQLIQGRPTEIHGLMGYLMHIEALDREKRNAENDVVEGEVSEQDSKEDTGASDLGTSAG